MKRTLFCLVVLILIGARPDFLLAKELPDAAKSTAGKDSLNKQLSVEQATQLVRVNIFQKNPNMNPTYTFSLEEWTTEDIWRQLSAQVFRMKEGELKTGEEGCGLLIKEGQIYWLGGCFGGSGLMSLCVADLNYDQHPELIYSYSWGAGIHRSEIALYTEQSSQPQVIRWKDAYLGDIFLNKIDQDTIVVEERSRTTNETAAPSVTLGKLVL